MLITLSSEESLNLTHLKPSMLTIGITGGIGSGKSTTCQIFEVFGIPVFYADKAAKSILASNERVKKSVKEAFGTQAYTPAGDFNKKYLADIVFKNKDQLERLNALVHPTVFRAFDEWRSAQSRVPYVVKEAALLFESGSYKKCHYSVLVTAPLTLKISRILKRDRLSVEEITKRINLQFSDEQKHAMADFILVNDEQTLLLPQVIRLHKHFLSLEKHP